MAAKLPKLTNAASYANWKKKVTEFILFYADGAQLIHLEHVRAWLELKVPLPPEFEHLPMEPGSMASASKAQLERMAAFNAQSRKFLSQAVKEAEATERILEYGSETISETDGDEVAQAKLAKAQADLPPGTTVDCKILERSQSEAGNEGEGLRSRWISGCIVCEVKLENGHVQYLCFIPEDYSGKKVNRTQSFDHQDVRLKAGKTLKIAGRTRRLGSRWPSKTLFIPSVAMRRMMKRTSVGHHCPSTTVRLPLVFSRHLMAARLWSVVSRLSNRLRLVLNLRRRDLTPSQGDDPSCFVRRPVVLFRLRRRACLNLRRRQHLHLMQWKMIRQLPW